MATAKHQSRVSGERKGSKMGQTVEPVNVNPTPKRKSTKGYGSGKKVGGGVRGKRTKSMKLANGTTTGIMTPFTSSRNGIGR